MEKNNKYFVILGDVIKSSQQSGVQKRLHDAIIEINRQISESWKTAIEITRGDEVAVVVDEECNWFDLIKKFNDLVYPLKFRWVIVYDEITEGLSTKSSAEAVGPAFIKSDNLMQRLKKTGLYFDIELGKKKWNEQLRGIINLIFWRLYKLSSLQLKILRKYQSTNRQQDVAKLLGKSQQQIQKSLKAIGWEIINVSEKSIDCIIQEINQKLKDKKF
jgi:hypothetical protein